MKDHRGLGRPDAGTASRLIAMSAVTACALALGGCHQPGFGPADTPAGPSAHAMLPRRAAPYLGVYEPGVPGSDRLVRQFARTVGRQPSIALYFSGWFEKFDAAFARAARNAGTTVLVDLQPTQVSMASIAAGQSDGYLRSFAEAVRAFGHPVIISLAHEMNGQWYRWGWKHTPPQVWISAWRHVVTVFRQNGADNVTWLWTVNRLARREGPIRDWWPGASYVTWAGIDGYYEQPGDSFAVVFDPTIAAIRKLTSKPVLIAETAVGQDGGQSAKIPGLFAGVRSRHLLGLVWFDVAQHDGVHHQDWRIEGHPSAVQAFRRELRSYQ
jgi:hypothetical protein